MLITLDVKAHPVRLNDKVWQNNLGAYDIVRCMARGGQNALFHSMALLVMYMYVKNDDHVLHIVPLRKASLLLDVRRWSWERLREAHIPSLVQYMHALYLYLYLTCTLSRELGTFIYLESNGSKHPSAQEHIRVYGLCPHKIR